MSGGWVLIPGRGGGSDYYERPKPGHPGTVERCAAEVLARPENRSVARGGAWNESKRSLRSVKREPMQVAITEWAWEQMLRERHTDLGLRGLGDGVDCSSGAEATPLLEGTPKLATRGSELEPRRVENRRGRERMAGRAQKRLGIPRGHRACEEHRGPLQVAARMGDRRRDTSEPRWWGPQTD
jgi:hypothetical protein